MVFQGPCTSSKPVVVQVLGTIKGLNDLSLYEEPYWFLFENVEGLVIIGNGVFDGQGSSAWKVAGDCGSSSDGCSPLPSVSATLSYQLVRALLDVIPKS